MISCRYLESISPEPSSEFFCNSSLFSQTLHLSLSREHPISSDYSPFSLLILSFPRNSASCPRNVPQAEQQYLCRVSISVAIKCDPAWNGFLSNQPKLLKDTHGQSTLLTWEARALPSSEFLPTSNFQNQRKSCLS